MTTDEAQERWSRAHGRLQLPEGYAWDWGQLGPRPRRGAGHHAARRVLSLVAVMLLMAALFESFTQPLAILITLPLALFGAFWTLWLFGFDPRTRSASSA